MSWPNPSVSTREPWRRRWTASTASRAAVSTRTSGGVPIRWDLTWGDPDHEPNPALGTLERPPFYAVPVFPGAIATRGGLRVDGSGHVLAAADRAPIPGLYASGNCSNASAAGSYCGPGATIGAAMTFAYLVGRQVVDAVGARKS